MGIMSRWDISLRVNGDDVTLDSTMMSIRLAGVNESDDDCPQSLIGKDDRSFYGSELYVVIRGDTNQP